MAALVVIAVVVVALVGGGGGGSNQSASDHQKASSTSTTTSTTAPPGTTAAAATTVPAAPVPKSANPVVALAQQYDGVYSGRFQNRTANTDGTAELTLRVDPATSKMTVDVAFNGDLFGSGSPAPHTISATIDLVDPNAPTTTQTKEFGPVTGKLDGTSVVLDAPAVPGSGPNSFHLRGSLVDRGFDSTYSVGFPGGHTTEGTVAVRCAPTGQRPSQVTTVCAQPG